MVRLPSFLRWIYPNAIWNLPSERKVVYLTFDDGPTPVVTEKILTLLEDYQAKATFFCIGKNIEQHPELFKLVKVKGHQVIMWDILSKDYDASLTPETVLNNVLRNIKPGAIIVFHDSEKAKKNVIAVLPQLLQYLKQQGYAMEAIPY